GGGGAKKYDGRGGFGGGPGGARGDAFLLGERREPVFATLMLFRASLETALPLTGIDKPEQNGVDADTRREFNRQRFEQVLHACPRRRGADHMWLRLQRQQGIDPDDCRGLAALQQRTQGADRQDLTEELELQLLAPLGVGRIGES